MLLNIFKAMGFLNLFKLSQSNQITFYSVFIILKKTLSCNFFILINVS